jgi:hypothetical protein
MDSSQDSQASPRCAASTDMEQYVARPSYRKKVAALGEPIVPLDRDYGT